MKNAILHISDLHFMSDRHTINTNFNDPFQTTFFEYLESELNKKDLKLKYIIITGDISDSGKKQEFDKVAAFLNEIVEHFKIDKKFILICPGNHDINWDLLETYLDTIPHEDAKQPYEYHEKKFERFLDFYNAFFKETSSKSFDPSKAIVDMIFDETDNLLLLGLNSCFKESSEKSDHFGFIDYKSLKANITSDFISKYNTTNKLFALHHNPKDFLEEPSSVDNWKDIKTLLKNSFPTILSGHIHNSDSEGEIVTNDINQYYVTVGSFAKKGTDNSFNILYESDEDKRKYKILYFEYANKPKPYWQLHDNKLAIKEVSLSTTTGVSVLESDKKSAPLLSKNTDIKTIIDKAEKNSNTDLTQKNDNYVNKLVQIIKEKNLFKSGHFHWSETFRSHGIIDINYLISNKISIDLICNLFKLKINAVFIESKPDLILGIGIEGNVIGARLSVIFPNSVYSFIPDSPKEIDFSSFEQDVKSGQYSKIVLIKDILFEADNLKEILTRDIFIDKELYVFSLFYCGSKPDIEVFTNENIKHYSICNKIKINTCKTCVDNCSIIEHELDTYYTLYTPEKL